MTDRSFIFVLEMTKAEKTRQWIIEQSAPIFNTRGVAGTAMSDIMAATKLAKGSLYVHFESKEELAYSAVDYILDSFSAKITDSAGRQTSAKAKLIAVVDKLTDPSTPPVIGGCPLLNFGMESDDTNPVIREKVKKAINGLIKGIERIIDKGISNGEFRGNLNAKEFATKIFAMIEGGVLMSRVSGSPGQLTLIVHIIKKEIEALKK